MNDEQRSSTPPGLPAAGWYPDSAGVLRWWDGAQWTEHVHTAAVVPRSQGNASNVGSESKTGGFFSGPRLLIMGAVAGVLFAGMGIAAAIVSGGEDSGSKAPKVASFESLADLRSGFEEQGGSCEEWDLTNKNFGSCDDDTVLFRYETREAAKAKVDQLTGLLGSLDLDYNYLAGPTWIIDDPDAQSYQDAFGGTMVMSDGDGETSSDSGSDSAEADISFDHTCDYVLGDFTDDPKTGYRFIADVELTNAGGGQGTVELIATWYLSGGDKIVRKKTVTVDANSDERLGFSVPATSDEIDRHQSASGDACEVDGAPVE